MDPRPPHLPGQPGRNAPTINAAMLAGHLEEHGYEVLLAENGEEDLSKPLSIKKLVQTVHRLSKPAV
jgi:ADP-heptose:LPS heptosyltransferase